ncbi:MAG: YbaB/EbfC family nucleoid-associated protein [Alphaproteobacteria bacterium]|nr:YbaB/EbfC family nucleoid-associated protein [Alphaproteobacteria bacterium]
MNITDMLKQAQGLQKKMEEIKEEISQMEYHGKSGGGLVSIALKGDGKMKSVSLDPSLCVPAEKEVLADLIVAAFNDAKEKQDKDSQERMGNIMGGMVPGFKMPF